MDSKFDSVLSFTCRKIQKALNCIPDYIKSYAQEIRLKSNRCLHIICRNEIYFLNLYGEIFNNIPENPLIITPEDLIECLRNMCHDSIYSFQEQIKDNFITLPGGNRVGISGTAVIKNNIISNIKNITSLNIRIAREIKGCATEIFRSIKHDHLGILIIGPPGCGKTTVLRDLARIISISNDFKKVTIADERLEIAATFQAIPQLDIGLCDILTGFPKSESIMRAIRCLSPDTIICDEIGSEEDVQAIIQSLNCGVQIIASMHSKNLDEFLRRPQALKILKSNSFGKIIFLKNSSSPGVIDKIYKVSDICGQIDRNIDNSAVRYLKRINDI